MLRMKFLRCSHYFEDVSQDCGVWCRINVKQEGDEHVAVGLECPCRMAEGAVGLAGSSVQEHGPLYLSKGAVGDGALKAGRGFSCLLPPD